MTRIDQIRARLAAATFERGVKTIAESLAQDNAQKALEEHAPQDLRDLLELADAARDVLKDYPLSIGTDLVGHNNRLMTLKAILSRLDSPVGDEGAK